MRFPQGLRPTRSSVLFASILCAVLALGCLSDVARAGMTTGNKFVTALVEDGSGLISWYEGTSTNTPPSTQLSFRNKSYLSIKVGTKVYSNNDVSSPNGNVQDVTMDNGTNTKIGDTIHTVWEESGFDIVQDVYPVEFEKSGQVVFRITIINHSGSLLSVQAQYLLDVDVNGKDDAHTLTRYNYSPNWLLYPNPSHPVPWFFLGFENPPTGANPGHIGTGYVTNDLTPAPMGLMAPEILAVVDWKIESDWAWGLPSNAPWGAGYRDNGIFLQWKVTGVSGQKDTVQEIARGTYGTGEYEICYGNLLGITFYPHRIKYDWKGRHYVPNPFTVEAMIFNVNSNQDATKARASLNTYALTPPGPLRIKSPAGATTKPDGSFIQVQDIGNGIIPGTGGTIPRLDVAEATWIDSTLDVLNCNGDSAVSMTLNVTCQGINQPSFIPPCEMPLIIECTVTDTIPPKYVVKAGPTKYDTTITVTDNGTPVDKGLDFISWSFPDPTVASAVAIDLKWGGATPGTSTKNPTLFKPTPGCLFDPVDINIIHKDTEVYVCVDFFFTDCNGNLTKRTVCLPGNPQPNHPDSLPPVFTLLDHFNPNPNPDVKCNWQRSNWNVSDIRKYDAGLLSVDVLPGSANNMNFHLSKPQVDLGDRSVDFQISVIDSMQDGCIIIVATDSVNPHHMSYDTICYCTYHDILSPVMTVAAAPVSGAWAVHVEDIRPWDRKMGCVYFTQMANCTVTPQTGWTPGGTVDSITTCATPAIGTGDFSVVITDSHVKACFTVYARDVAGNWSDTVTRCSDFIPDVNCPKITFETITTNPLKVKVRISDEHFDASNHLDPYDLGIDSIWFTAPHNLTLIRADGSPSTTFPPIDEPQRIGQFPPYPLVDSFYLIITDPNTSDATPACVTINAKDSAGNMLFCRGDTTFCYPITPDFHVPKVLATNPSHSSIDVQVTDNQANDRGIGQISIRKHTNFAAPFSVLPYDSLFTNGNSKQYALTLNVITKGKSAFARVWTIDSFGVLTGNLAGHADSADVWIYAQDLRMTSHLVEASETAAFQTFPLPVYLKETDAIPLGQKNITQYQFSFTLNPPSPLVSFKGVETIGTLSAGWTVTPALNSNPMAPYTVTGTSTGASLPDMPTSADWNTKPLLYLMFEGMSSPNPSKTDIQILGTAGEEVTYNGGTNTTFNTTPDATVTLPAPYGAFSGGSVIFQGTCSPIAGPHLTKPNQISIAPTTPNPASTSAVVIYTIPDEGQVLLELYNVLGERLRTVVSEVQKQGEYKLDLTASDLAEGTYFLRLTSGGKVVTRMVAIGR